MILKLANMTIWRSMHNVRDRKDDLVEPNRRLSKLILLLMEG